MQLLIFVVKYYRNIGSININIKNQICMKKFIPFLLMLVVCSNVLFAQLKVANNGNAGIQLGTSTPLSALSINGVGSANNMVDITGTTNGLNVKRTGTANYHWTYGIIGTSDVTASCNVGIRGQSYSPSPLDSRRAWGLFGLAGNSTSGYNYGVFGTIYGSQNGAGIVGTVGNNQDVDVPGIYAGYFVGDVKVTGLINGVMVGNSDKRYKKNIVDLATKATLNNVLQMMPVEYNLNQIYTESKGDTATVKKALYDEKSQMFMKKHYGLIAQEFQKLYPDLVYEDGNGYLSINYIGIIPLLIESIKELNSEIAALKMSVNSGSVSKVKSSGDIPVAETQVAALYQNSPNPFSQTTQIKYYLPSTVQSALLCIYDLQGKQLKQINISERGNGSQLISAAEFAAGIYLYGLIADGNEVDVKRMILTN